MRTQRNRFPVPITACGPAMLKKMGAAVPLGKHRTDEEVNEDVEIMP